MPDMICGLSSLRRGGITPEFLMHSRFRGKKKKGGFAPRFRPSQVRGERADSRFPAAHPRGGGNELIPSVADAMNFVRQRSRIG